MSELVSGKRPINRTHIEKLAPYLNVRASVFLEGAHTALRKASHVKGKEPVVATV